MARRTGWARSAPGCGVLRSTSSTLPAAPRATRRSSVTAISSAAPCTLTLAPLDSACPRCARPSAVRLARPPPCLGCLQRPPRFDAAVAGFEFGGAIAEAIRSLKWHNMPELAAPLGELLLPRAGARAARLRRGRRDRAGAAARAAAARARVQPGGELAAALRESARARGAPLGEVAIDARALERMRDTPPQTGLDAAQRRRNVYDAFRVRRSGRACAGGACSSSTT